MEPGMWKYFGDLLNLVHRLVWGPGLLVLMLGAGILYTGKSRGFQILGWKVWWRETIGGGERYTSVEDRAKMEKTVRVHEDSGASGVNSGFRTACTALAATIGTGNIVGVATALKAGGPGAIFWMWISAFLGMMTGYAEVWLGIQYRHRNERGTWIGGAVTYLARGVKCPWLGAVYGVFCLLASFGMGGMVQSNGAVQTLQFTFGIPAVVGTLAVGGLTVAVLAGGNERIMGVAERLIPLASAVYVVCAGVVILTSYERIPVVLTEIFRYALLPQAVAGGVGGYGICQAVRYGIARGVFSNEAGLGSLAGLHGEAKEEKRLAVDEAGGNCGYVTEEIQGMWAIFEVFFDTIVICTMTALVILCSSGGAAGLCGIRLDGAALAAWSFGQVCGKMGEWLIALAMLVFSFATMIAWFYLGRQTLEAVMELVKTMREKGHSRKRVERTTAWKREAGSHQESSGRERIHQWYFSLYSVCIILGGLTRLEAVWKLSDIWNGLMAFPNLLALFWLQRQVHFPWVASGVRDTTGKPEFRFWERGKQQGKP